MNKGFALKTDAQYWYQFLQPKYGLGPMKKYSIAQLRSMVIKHYTDMGYTREEAERRL